MCKLVSILLQKAPKFVNCGSPFIIFFVSDNLLSDNPAILNYIFRTYELDNWFLFSFGYLKNGFNAYVYFFVFHHGVVYIIDLLTFSMAKDSSFFVYLLHFHTLSLQKK